MLGETITYRITVTNDGNVTLRNVVVTDELTGAEWTIESLAPGASRDFTTSYVVTEKDVGAGKVVNVAVAEADNPNFDPKDPNDPNNPPKVPGGPSSVEDPVQTEKTETTSSGDTPQTGDYSHLALWLVLLIASACGMFAALWIARKRDSAEAKDKPVK